MEMNRNRDDVEVAELLAGASDGETGQEPDLRRQLSRAHDALLTASERPEIFWYRQQAAIRSRIAMEKTSKQPLWGSLIATSALILLTVLLLRPSKIGRASCRERV